MAKKAASKRRKTSGPDGRKSTRPAKGSRQNSGEDRAEAEVKPPTPRKTRARTGTTRRVAAVFSSDEEGEEDL